MNQINDNSVIERIVRPVPPEHHNERVVEHPVAPAVPAYEGEDLSDLELHVAEHSDVELPDICIECARPAKKHTISQAFKCRRAAEKRLAEREFEGAGDVVDDAPPSPYDRPGSWYLVHTQIGREQTVARALDAREHDRLHEIVEKKGLFPGYVVVRCDLNDELWDLIRRAPNVTNFVSGAGARPSPMSRKDVENFVLAEAPPPRAPRSDTNGHVETRTEVLVVDEVIHRAPPPQSDLPESLTAPAPAAVPLNDKGEIDYEAIAKAMRKVIDDERDEIIRRGGPIEKQNLELKVRLAEQVEQTQMWRARHHTAVQERNSYKEQLDESIKVNRKLRNDQREKKMKDHVRLVELEDILAVVDKTSGWTREMGGTGHWQIYKNGVWVSDAAGSGGSTKVNMATRTKLRSAGLKV